MRFNNEPSHLSFSVPPKNDGSRKDGTEFKGPDHYRMNWQERRGNAREITNKARPLITGVTMEYLIIWIISSVPIGLIAGRFIAAGDRE